MAKTIKIDDKVYERLDEFREKGETWSQAVERVVKCAETISTVQDILGPGHHSMKRPQWLGVKDELP